MGSSALADGSTAAAAPGGTRALRSRGGSNVNAVGAMVGQIELAQQFEAQVKLRMPQNFWMKAPFRLVRQG